MYNLYDDVTENDFIWIQCEDSFKKREIVQEFVLNGYASNLEDLDYDGLPHLIIDIKNKVVLHCGPSMAITLKRNKITSKNGYEFLKIVAN